ncbi:MAG: hypothetical protein WCR46_01935 [Deltaproteobacteria bacterium]|jgi:hypothetical protein
MPSGVFWKSQKPDVFSVIRHLICVKPCLSSLKKALQDNKQDVFQEELRCAQRYMLSVLPGTIGVMKAISVDYCAAMNMPDDTL